MKGGSDIVSAIHSIKQAHDHYTSFVLEHPGSKGAQLVQSYQKRLEWIIKDLITHPFLTDEVRAGIKKEWESDVFAVPAINEKIPLLQPEQRNLIENLVDAMLRGEEIKMF